VFIVVATTNI